MLGAMKPTLTRRKLRQPRWGVTLVELMVTLAIMAVLVAVALPSMRDFVARKRLEGVAQELLTDLRMLKSQQMVKGREAAIKFGTSTEQTCYALYIIGTYGRMPHCDCTLPAGTECGPASAVGKSELIRVASIPRSTGVTLAANRSETSLFNGMPVGNATLQATIESSRIGSIRVSTNSLWLTSACSVSGVFGSLTQCP